jgi:TatD DNase family protein
MWSDSHAHLFDLNDEEFTEELKRIEEANISNILNLATNLETAKTVIKQVKPLSYGSSNIYGAIGVCTADTRSISNNKDWLDELEELSKNSNIVAIGEVGIDGLNSNYEPLEKQLPIFREQLILAKRLNLPLSIHTRGAEAKALDICRELNIEQAVFHCYTGDIDTAIDITSSGYYISLSGIVTFKNSDFDSLINSIPSNKLLIETDSPYLAPVPKRGKPNSPAFLPHIGDYCSTILGIETHELANITTQNFKSLFLL